MVWYTKKTKISNWSRRYKYLFVSYGLLLTFLCGGKVSHGQEVALGLSIRSDFPGGNILIRKIIADTIWLEPDTKDINGDWFYWYFSIESETDREIHFIFPKRKIPSFGPAVSLDGGNNWNWMYDKIHKNQKSFTYVLKAGRETRFSMGFPYTKANFDSFMKKYRTHPYVRLDTLCTSRLGTEVPTLYIRNPTDPPQKKIMITARHHACEMMANYVIEGFVSHLLADGGEHWLRDNFEFLIIPFVDMDGVDKGEQGKNRRPRDHNRDYSGASIYETTAAIQSWVPQWSHDNLDVALDLHCPYLVGKAHEFLYIVGSDNQRFAKKEECFAKVLSASLKNGLTFGESGLVAFGTSWNVGNSYAYGDTFKRWIQKQFPNVELATTLEIPYANNEGQQVTIENLKLLGEDLAKALAVYLK